jgi:acylaminoacyl-peptidase
MRIRLLCCVLLMGGHAFAGEAPVASSAWFEPMDVFQLQWADDPVISPDGRQVVYQRYWFDIMKDRKRSNLWIIDADGDGHRPLTSGSANDGGATWSPDGKRLAWVASDDRDTPDLGGSMYSCEDAPVTHLTE